MSWIVTTDGTRDKIGTIPLVKCTTSARTFFSAAAARVCIHTMRATRRGAVATRTRGGSGSSVSIGWFDTTISSSSIASCARCRSRCSE